jgi:hypothetical protein
MSIGQIADLTESLDLISYKVGIYEERLAEGTADQLWSAPRPEATQPEPEAARQNQRGTESLGLRLRPGRTATMAGTCRTGDPPSGGPDDRRTSLPTR